MYENILGEAFSILQKFSPIIATAIGNPELGALTTFIIGMLSSAFGVTSKDLASLSTAILSDPDPSLKLSELETTVKPFITSMLKRFSLPSQAELTLKLSWPTDTRL